MMMIMMMAASIVTTMMLLLLLMMIIMIRFRRQMGYQIGIYSRYVMLYHWLDMANSKQK